MPVRVVISPSQSSFFAGEPFSATITFTNVAAPESSPARVHKRGAHSISSAPLARPPTSPGLPPRKSSAFARDSLPVRKGLIGAPIAYDKPLFIETRQSPTSPRLPAALSRTDTLALSSDHPHARKSSILDGQLSLDALSPTTSIPPRPHTPPTNSLSLTTISESSHTTSLPSSPLSMSSSPTTPRVSSPLSPSYSHPAFQPGPSSNTVQAYPSIAETTPRPHSYHHRRFSQQVQIGLGHPTPPQSAFASTFPKSNNAELILYSYAQLVGTVHVLPESISGNGVPPSTQEQTLRMNRIRRMLIRRRAVVGGGSMDISRSLHHRNWGSIGGGAGLQPPPSSRRLAAQQPHQHSHSASFSQSLMSLLSPSPSTTDGGLTTTSPSNTYDNVSTPGGGHGLGLGISTNSGNPIDEVVDPTLALPTFEAQPSMLAVDLVLAPGESKTYTYTIKLPDVLPPTYRGRALSFSYELVVGTCRARSSSPPTKSAGGGSGVGVNSVSRVMKVPIRVYNHVTVDHPPRPYDILWPVTHNHTRNYQPRSAGGGREMMIPEVQGRVVEENDDDDDDDGMSKLMTPMMRKKSSTSIRLSSGGRKGEDESCLNELRQYTKRLLTSLPPPPPTNVVNGKVGEDDDDDEVISPLSSQSESSSLPTTTTITTNNDNNQLKNSSLSSKNTINRERREEEEDKNLITGCREAVEILTRLPKKASYDVNKEGIKVAVLTFTKSAYRLGETVSGVVELNERIGRARVVQLSAILEAHEVLPKTIAPDQTAKYLKRAYAEHYASFTLNTLRTTFALDIPSDASPAFQVKIDDDDDDDDDNDNHDNSFPTSMKKGLGGLEWKIRLCLFVGIASAESDRGSEGVLFRSLERDGGRGEWGSSWCAPRRFFPLEKEKKKKRGLAVEEEEKKKGVRMMEEGTKSWTRIFVDSMWSAVTGLGGEDEDELDGKEEEEEKESMTKKKMRDYDGIKPDLGGGIGRGVDFSGDDDDDNDDDDAGWREVKMETVECEVPIKVWPGNTAFRAVDVVFDV